MPTRVISLRCLVWKWIRETFERNDLGGVAHRFVATLVVDYEGQVCHPQIRGGIIGQIGV